MNTIFIIEHDKLICDLLITSLTKAGYECRCEYDGIKATDTLVNERFDLILLDRMLPGVDGFELMEYIQSLEIPTIFISDRCSVEDKVRGLRMGADDYIVKPFDITELLARMETVLRRYHKIDRMLEIAGVKIDTLSMIARRGDMELTLTRKEYELILLFARNPGLALYRETIYERVWGGDFFGDSRTIDLHIQRIRKKAGWEDKLQSVYKVGYRLAV